MKKNKVIILIITFILIGLVVSFIFGIYVLIKMGEASREIISFDINNYNYDFPDALPPDFSKVSPINSDDHIIGAENAKAIIFVYADFQCQLSADFYENIKQIFSEFGDNILLAHRHFPQNYINPMAQKAAEASECAAEQGKFWEMHEILFANQKLLSMDNIKSYAMDLGLDAESFDKCFESDIYASKILLQSKDAAEAGIYDTPGIFINEQFVSRIISYDGLKKIMETILEN